MTGPLMAIGLAYLLAGIPVAAIALAGRLSPMYRMPTGWYLRCWSWMALAFVVCALVTVRLPESV